MSRLPRYLIAPLVVLSAAAPAGAGILGQTLVVSTPDQGRPAPQPFDNDSRAGALSSDGRYSAFTSEADGFADGADPHVENVFLRDSQTGATTLVSRSDGASGAGANSDSSEPSVAVSADGHVLVAFATRATNLSDHATGPVAPPENGSHVWLRDVTAGTTTLISRAGKSGEPGDGESAQPSIDVTPAGPVVAFTTFAKNIAPGGAGVVLRTVGAGVNELVSCKNKNCAQPAAAADARDPSVRVVPAAAGTLCLPAARPNGCVLVAFATSERTLTGDNFGFSQIVVAAANAPATAGSATGTFDAFTTASVKSDGTVGNQSASVPSFGADGKAVAFVSMAHNLTAETVPVNGREAFVHRFDTGSTELLSKTDAGVANAADNVALGGDVAHLRAGFDAVGGGFGDGRDVWLRDVGAATTKRLNASSDGAPGDGAPFGAPALSADGKVAAFGTLARNVAGDPGDNFAHVYARKLDDAGAALALVSRPSGTEALPAGAEPSKLLNPSSVSADGRYTVFTSTERLTADAPRGRGRIVYVRDAVTGRVSIVSRADGADGAVSPDATGGGIRANGSRVVFDSGGQTWVRDVAAGRTILASRADGAGGAAATGTTFGAAISADGDSVAVITAAPLTPAGADGRDHLYVRNIDAGTTVLADRDSGANGTVPAETTVAADIDADGSHVAWTSRAALAGAPNSGLAHAYVRDLRTNVTTLVSRADGADGASLAGSASDPVLDASGDHVALVDTEAAGGKSTVARVIVRDVDVGRTEFVSKNNADVKFDDAGKPSLDASGRRVTFFVRGSSGYAVYLRDRDTQTTELVSRPSGSDEPAFSQTFAESAIAPNGDCVAFSGAFTGLGDGFDSVDFEAVHMRALRSDCPARPLNPSGGGPAARDDGGRDDPPRNSGNGGTTVPPKPPILSALRFAPSHFWVRGFRSGTQVTYRLTRAAKVTFRIDRLISGRVKGHRCLTGPKRGKRCQIVKRVASFRKNGRAGANKFVFAGNVGRTTLRRGSYRLTATPDGGRADTSRFAVVIAPQVSPRREG